MELQNLKNKPNTIKISIQTIPVIRQSFSRLKCRIEFSRHVINSLKFKHLARNEFLTSQLHIVVFHSCVKYVSYECYRTKVETSCFTDLRHLVIIIAINMWLYSNQSRFGFWGTHCITLSSMLKQGRMQDFPIGGAEMSSLPVGGRPLAISIGGGGEIIWQATTTTKKGPHIPSSAHSRAQ